MASCEIKVEKDCCYVQGVLDFETVPDALDKVSSLLNKNQIHAVDLKGVTDSNSAGLAMLIELQAIASRKSLALTIDHIPSQILRLAEVSKLGTLNLTLPST